MIVCVKFAGLRSNSEEKIGNKYGYVAGKEGISNFQIISEIMLKDDRSQPVVARD